jgi:hypothetical protein
MEELKFVETPGSKDPTTRRYNSKELNPQGKGSPSRSACSLYACLCNTPPPPQTTPLGPIMSLTADPNTFSQVSQHFLFIAAYIPHFFTWNFHFIPHFSRHPAVLPTTTHSSQHALSHRLPSTDHSVLLASGYDQLLRIYKICISDQNLSTCPRTQHEEHKHHKKTSNHNVWLHLNSQILLTSHANNEVTITELTNSKNNEKS